MKYKIFSWFLCLMDILIVGVAFFLVAWYRTGTRVIISRYDTPLIVFTIIWISISILGCKFDLKPPKRLSSIISCILRDNLTSFGIILILMYVTRLFYFSRYIVLGTILVTTIIELIIFIIIYQMFRLYKETDIAEESSLVTRSPLLDSEVGTFYTNGNGNLADEIPYAPDFGEPKLSETVMLKLWGRYLDEYGKLFNFINEMITLTHFSDKASMILKSSTLFNIEHLDELSQQLFINLHPINNFRRINRYLIRVNKNLVPGGVFVCCAETIDQRYSRMIGTYGRIVGNILYFFDFILRRIFPKLKITQGLYFALTGGRNRSLSETEILGRFYYCGFKLIGFKDIDGLMYFVIKKVQEPSTDLSPSYGPLIKLRRVGLEGKNFYCYKFRTMHPYSEYLQEYVHNYYSVSHSGKFANDFRITNWGKFMRSVWLDELPQLINLLRGDLRLIGTRAISNHYFEQYPQDVKEMRLHIKPGLIPVYTADKATNLPALINSERCFLKQHQQQPFLTDCKYLFKALFNISTGRVKSLDCYK